MKRLARRGVTPALIALSVAGCGGSGGGSSSRSGASVAASTSASNTAPLGSSTTASTTSATPSLAKNGPTITVTSPQRGAFLTQPVAKVEGKVTDPNGVSALFIQGNPVVPTSTGAFAEVVPLQPGLNTIVVEAWNSGSRKSKVSISVVEGQFLQDTQAVPDALSLRLNTEGLDAIANTAAGQLGGATLAQQILALNPLYSNSVKALGVTIASAVVNATKASFGNPTLKLTPLAGALAVHAEIPYVDIEANAHDQGGIPYSITGHVTADRAIVDAQIVLTAQNGVLVSTVQNSACHLQNFGWGLNGIPSLITNLASSWVEKTIENAVTKQVNTVVPNELNKALAGLAKGFTAPIMGSTASFAVAPTFVQQDALGMTIRAAANVGMQPVAGYIPLTAPGSYYTGGAAPTPGGPTPGFLASINQDLMNRTGHAAWRSGITELELSNQPSSTFKVPPYFILDGAFLTGWIPEFAGKVPANDPIALVVSPKLPPIFQAKPKPDTIEAGIGELEVSVYDIAPGAGRKLLITFAAHVRGAAHASIAAGNVIKVNVNPNVTVDASVVSSPVVPDFDATGVSNFVQFTIPPIIQIAANTWSGFPLPIYPGLAPRNVDMDADGAQKTFVTVKGDL